MNRQWIASWFSGGKAATDKDSFVFGILCGVEFGLALGAFAGGVYIASAFCATMGFLCCFRAWHPIPKGRDGGE